MTCATCRHRIETTCHRFPPQLYPNQVRVWPTIALTDTCGEHTTPKRSIIQYWLGLLGARK